MIANQTIRFFCVQNKHNISRAIPYRALDELRDMGLIDEAKEELRDALKIGRL